MRSTRHRLRNRCKFISYVTTPFIKSQKSGGVRLRHLAGEFCPANYIRQIMSPDVWKSPLCGPQQLPAKSGFDNKRPPRSERSKFRYTARNKREQSGNSSYEWAYIEEQCSIQYWFSFNSTKESDFSQVHMLQVSQNFLDKSHFSNRGCHILIVWVYITDAKMLSLL